MLSVIIPAAFDAAVTAFAVYLIAEYAISLAIKGAATVVLSAVIAAAAFIATFFIFEGRGAKAKAKLAAKKDFDRRMCRLYLCTDDEIQAIFGAIISDLHICATVSGRHMRLADGATMIAPLLDEPYSGDDVIREYRAAGRRLAIISRAFSPKATAVAETLGVTLVSTRSFANYLDERGLLPAAEEPRKPAVKSRLSVFFYRKNGRRFLVYGAFLCAVSSVVFYPVYYLVFGTVFIVYGLIAAFFGKYADDGGKKEDLENFLKTDRL